MRRALFDETVRAMLGPILEHLDDREVTEVLINGAREIFVERGGRLFSTASRFDDDAALLAAIRHVAQYVGHRIDEEHPILEGRLPDGSRIEAIIPPASPDAPIMAIRRFSDTRLSMAQLIEWGALSAGAADYLQSVVTLRKNLLVAGGTGSGKTSLLNALSELVPDGERIVVIEDARELRLRGSHVVSLEARPADARGRGRVSVRDLFKATLRLRPDRIVVGEIRAGEALDLVQAMTSGHGGCLSTIHASRPAEALTRLETLALMSDVALPLHALQSQVRSAIDVIVQTERFGDGSRGISHIAELSSESGDRGYLLQSRFSRVGGLLVPTHDGPSPTGPASALRRAH
jgi:pilus assembly protein CpaF